MRRLAIQIRTLLWKGLPALAVYALVLQAFLAGAAPAAAFDAGATPLCSQMSASGGAPSPIHPAGHDNDCVCAASCVAPHASLALAPVDQTPLAHRIATASSPAPGAQTPTHEMRRHAGAGARGPPRG